METTLRIIAKSKKNSHQKKLTVTFEEVVLFKSDINYTEIYLETGECMVVSKTLKEMEEQLMENDSFA